LPSFQYTPGSNPQFKKGAPKRKRGWVAKSLLVILGLTFTLYLVCAALIFSLRSFNPPTTAVQIQREVEALLAKKTYNKRQLYVSLSRIAPDLQYAVVAAEDGRFYVHHGFDWLELQKVMQTDLARKSLGRGASTITQQLAKNMFLGTERSIIKKGIESVLVPLFEWFLTKNRILELYLNEIEWGPGVFGAEAATEFWYKEPATQITRDQAARLAAIIPNPLKRAPSREDEYSEEILGRMKKMGW
jgi:monofunctional biosynthetic peptidoglycan transglycosylase